MLPSVLTGRKRIVKKLRMKIKAFVLVFTRKRKGDENTEVDGDHTLLFT